MFRSLRRRLTIHDAYIEIIGKGENTPVKVNDNGSFLGRNESTLTLIGEFLDLEKLTLPEGRSIGFWTEDFPPHRRKVYDYSLLYCARPSKLGPKDFLIPDFNFDHQKHSGIDDYTQVTADIERAGQETPKDPYLFWIGNDRTHANRLRLLKLSDKYDWLQAFSVRAAHTIPSKSSNYTHAPVSLPDHCRYKYLIDVEGRGYSGRIKFLMFSNRTLFIADRPYHEYFMADLVPFVHYIPVKRNFSDLAARYAWAEENPEKCTEIAQNALDFARRHLTREAAMKTMADIVLPIVADLKK